MQQEFIGRKISKGTAEGEALVSSDSISFYGGVDPETGIVTEKGHALEKQCISGKILVFPSGKGSTVGSYILYWMSEVGTAPLAIVNAESETIVAVGAIISDIPSVDLIDISEIQTGDFIKVNADEGKLMIINDLE